MIIIKNKFHRYFLFLCKKLADYPSVDFIQQSLQESLTILHAYLRPQMLSSDESDDYVKKLKQTVRPLASVATYNNSLKSKAIATANESKTRIEDFVFKNRKTHYNILIFI